MEPACKKVEHTHQIGRNEEDKDEEKTKSPGTWLGYIKIDQHVFTSWHNWGSSGLRALSFPSLALSIILNLSTFGIPT